MAIREDELLSLADQADRVDAEGHQLMLFDGPAQASPSKIISEPRLYKAGQPDPRHKGVIFRRWVGQLEKCGYKVEWKELVAADYGAPTTRKRLFLIARCDGQPIVWPERTHAPRDKAELLGLKPWLPAADIIDWSRPVPSIFGRKKPLEPKTLARISKGIKKYVIEAGRPFIVPVTHSTGGVRTYDSADPLKTVTAGPKRGEFSLVAPTMVPRYGERAGQQPRSLDITAPYPTVVPDGNGGQLVEAVLGGAIVGCGGRAGQSPPRGLDDPLGTVTAKADKCVAGVFMQKMAENGVGSEIDGPLHTAMAGAPRHYIVAAHLGRQFGTSATGLDITAPAPTVMSNGGGGKTQVVTAHLGRMAKGQIGSDLADPTQTATTHAKDTLAAISIDKYYGSGGGSDVSDPLATVTAKDRMSINATYLEQANTGMIGHDSRDPVSTIVGKGCTQRIVECCLDGFEAEPSPRRAEVLAFLWKEFGEPTEAERATPLATASGRLKFGLVVLDDVVWRIVDIGMRMLVPRELYGAQGFPPDYHIEIQFEGKPLTKTAQTRMAGNSVSPPPAAALLKVNYEPAFIERERVAA